MGDEEALNEEAMLSKIIFCTLWFCFLPSLAINIRTHNLAIIKIRMINIPKNDELAMNVAYYGISI